MATIANAQKCLSPILVNTYFPNAPSSVFEIWVYLTVWVGTEAQAPPQVTYRLIQPVTSSEYSYIDIAPYLRGTIYGNQNDTNPLANTNQACFYKYGIAGNTGSSMVPLADTTPNRLAVLGYFFNINNTATSVASDAPYLADGTVNMNFAVNNIASMQFKKLIKDSPYNRYVSGANLNVPNTRIDSTQTYSLYTGAEEQYYCGDEQIQLIFRDKNGLLDFLTITGRVKRRNTYERSVSMGGVQGSQEMLFGVNGYNLWDLNTGRIHPVLVNKVQELLLSRDIFLYDKNLNLETPVRILDSDFEAKNKINNKSKIDFNLKVQSSFRIKG